MVNVGEKIKIVGTPAFKGKVGKVVEVDEVAKLIKVEIPLTLRKVHLHFLIEDEGKIYTIAK